MRELKYEFVTIDNVLNLLNKNIISECDADSKKIFFKNKGEE